MLKVNVYQKISGKNRVILYCIVLILLFCYGSVTAECTFQCYMNTVNGIPYPVVSIN